MPLQMEEKDNSYVFSCEMPGLGPQDVKVGGSSGLAESTGCSFSLPPALHQLEKCVKHLLTIPCKYLQCYVHL